MDSEIGHFYRFGTYVDFVKLRDFVGAIIIIS